MALFVHVDHEGVGRGRQPVKEPAKVRPPGTERGTEMNELIVFLKTFIK